MLLNCRVGEDSWVPWAARRSNWSILKEISPEYSLEELMLKLKLQYYGHLMWRTYSLENTLMLGKIEGRRKRGWQRMRWLDSITDLMDMSLSRLWELVMDREAAVHVVTKSQTWQWMNWTEAKGNLLEGYWDLTEHRQAILSDLEQMRTKRSPEDKEAGSRRISQQVPLIRPCDSINKHHTYKIILITCFLF